MQSIEGVIRRRDRPGYLRSKYGKGIRSPLPQFGDGRGNNMSRPSRAGPYQEL